MLFRTAVIAALLAITPALAALNERNFEEPIELDIRSEMDDDAILARDVEDLERRFGLFKAFKAAFKIGKAINGAVHHHKHHRRGIESEGGLSVFERDLEDNELFERDIEGYEELFERDFGSDDELFERDLEGYEELFERDYENLDELD